ncbi:hypothetical protein WN59_06385 [Salinicoccus sediminis]|uniref:DUF3021 domain-containing protein n=1 Tax=Salinicoccus sediminis TaxID=1432562 RepID=A0A0M2SP16_9STAP|nr:DUF3021 family protein [Salinicoccus sediminis]KKK34662.1 hypothetical protein WN59_06385 [Salinicoccus sediminis]
MMLQNLLKSLALSIGIGSFIYLLNGVAGPLNEIQPKEIISVWIASALIGVASTLYYTKISESLVAVIQFAVGITAFTAVALLNGWITVDPADILFYAGAIFVIMLIIFFAFYFLSLLDSRKINDKLKEK